MNCSDLTQNGDYWYTYVLNNPLIYTDPSGYNTKLYINAIVSYLQSKGLDSWSTSNGFHNSSSVAPHLEHSGGGGGSYQPVYSYSINPTGDFWDFFIPTYIPSKGRYGWIRKKWNFKLNFSSEITGWRWAPNFSPLISEGMLGGSSSFVGSGGPVYSSPSGSGGGSSSAGGYNGPTPPGGIPRFENNYSQISQWEPSNIHNWSRSGNFFAKLSYNLMDGVSVTAQSFLRGPNSVHLTGELVRGDDRVDAFVNTASWVLFAGEVSTFNTTKTGIGVYSTRWGLRVQAHRHAMSPLKGRGATGVMYPFHININNTHIILNPRYWIFFY